MPRQPSARTSAPPASVSAPTRTPHTIPVRLGCTARRFRLPVFVCDPLFECFGDFLAKCCSFNGVRTISEIDHDARVSAGIAQVVKSDDSNAWSIGAFTRISCVGRARSRTARASKLSARRTQEHASCAMRHVAHGSRTDHAWIAHAQHEHRTKELSFAGKAARATRAVVCRRRRVLQAEHSADAWCRRSRTACAADLTGRVRAGIRSRARAVHSSRLRAARRTMSESLKRACAS